jgi:hypothetical protein
VRRRSRLRHCPSRLKHAPHPLTRSHGKTPTESVRKARREERPISRLQHLREPQWHTRRCSGATVGDSPRGPLKQTGESPLKTHDKPKLSAPHLNTQGRAHAAVALTAHQDSPLKDPLEQAPPRSRAHATPEQAPPGSRGCAYLEQAPPRSRTYSALERAPPRSRVPCTRAPVPVRGH